MSFETRFNRLGFVLAALLCLFGTSTAAAATRVVTNGSDTGADSLREAVSAANPGDTITFATGVTEVVLTSGQIILNTSLTINGPFVTVRRDADAPAFRIFAVAGGANVTLNDLTISGGSEFDGGAIYTGGTLTLTGCTLSGNTASGRFGGGIRNLGTLTIIRSTISGNSATTLGGGIYNDYVATVIGSTIAGNSGGFGAGGARSIGFMFLHNSIVADNTGGSGPDYLGYVDSGSDYFLIENTDGIQYGNVGTHYLTGVDPNLGPLQDNGGPTRTHALLAGSPAIDVGADYGQTRDQRGAITSSESTLDWAPWGTTADRRSPTRSSLAARRWTAGTTLRV